MMDEKRAREILAPDVIEGDEGLSCVGWYLDGWYLAWNPGHDNATLDGSFNADELEAIAWWIRNKGKP